MNITFIRLRYTQFFIICLIGVSLYAGSRSLAGGISQFEDNFWGREFLVTRFTNLRLKLGDRVFSQAVVGKQGWLEYTRDNNLDGYQNLVKTSPAGLKGTQQKIQKLYEELRKRNITLILVIPPNKATIYPDKMPNEIQRLDTQSKLDLFAAYLQQHGPPVLVDLRPALIQGRKQHDVYYKTDSHWNAYGAFIGYTEVMKELSKTYPGLAPADIKDFEIITGPPGLRDIVKIIAATNLLEPGIKFRPKKTQISAMPKDSLPALLMYMDSFGIRMQDFMSPHFKKATFLLDRSNEYPKALSLKAIDAIKPDIVVVEIVERLFNINVLDKTLKRLLSKKK